MPKKFGRKKQFRKKRFVRRGQRKQNNPLSFKVPNTQKKISLKVEGYIDIQQQSVAAGNNKVQVILPLNYPGQVVYDNGAGTNGTMDTIGSITHGGTPTSAMLGIFSTLFNNVTGIFDEYRVSKLVCRFLPNAQIVNTNGATDNVTTPDLNIVYHYNDIDDSTTLTGTKQANGEVHFMNSGAFPKGYVTGRPLTFMYKQLKEKKKFFLNAQIVSSQVPTGTNSIANTPFPDPFGSLKLLFCQASIAANATTIGRLHCCWYVVLRGIISTI